MDDARIVTMSIRHRYLQNVSSSVGTEVHHHVLTRNLEQAHRIADGVEDVRVA